MHDARIAKLAYRVWEERGRPEGSPDVDWFRAVHALRAEEDHRDIALSSVHVGPDTTAAWSLQSGRE